MRALNVLLAVLVSLVLALVVLEGGLSLMGKRPPARVTRFDPQLGWVKTPNARVQRSTREFEVSFEINALGLRDDPMDSPAKPPGRLRVLMLGDSFVQGYTVARADLFVDILERWWQSEGRDVDVVNAGTEAYSTDQEALWLSGPGRSFQPDVVLLFPYQNDLYWNAATNYNGVPKPRINPDGRLEPRVLAEPPPKAWWQRTALGALVDGLRQPRKRWTSAAGRQLEMEDAAFFRVPPEFLNEALARTRGALLHVKETCAELQARLVVVPIPHKAAVQEDAREALGRHLGEDPARWSADQPGQTFLSLCRELSIETLDVRPALQAAWQRDRAPQYFESDWHFNPRGNRLFARELHDELDRRGLFPAAYAAQRAEPEPPGTPESCALPRWIWFCAGLWLGLGALYARLYRDEPRWRAWLGVGAMLALVFGLGLGASRLLALLPARFALAVTVMLVGGLLLFVLWKLGRRLATTLELLWAFTRRGHWYLMPLVVVLLSIGSLLVVAASSPLVAPFIYTLF